MAARDNTAVVRQVLEAIARGDTGDLDAMVAAGFVGHHPPSVRSRVFPI